MATRSMAIIMTQYAHKIESGTMEKSRFQYDANAFLVLREADIPWICKSCANTSYLKLDIQSTNTFNGCIE